MFKYFPLVQILRIGLALTFLAAGLLVFFSPGDYLKLIAGSFLYRDLVKVAPFFIYYIGLNDICLAILLTFKFLPVETAWWAIFWILGVISVLMTQGTSSGYLGAIEHGAYLAIAIYLALSPSAKNS